MFQGMVQTSCMMLSVMLNQGGQRRVG
jgi:hypothetical protein